MSHAHTSWAVLPVLLLVLSLQGCAWQSGGDSGGAVTASVVGDWTLVSVGGDAVDSLIEITAQRPDLQVTEDGRLSGHAGVNRFSGTIDVNLIADGGFSTGPLASTRMAGPPDAMALEDRVLEALARANRFTVDGGRIHLLDGDQVILVFKAKP